MTAPSTSAGPGHPGPPAGRYGPATTPGRRRAARVGLVVLAVLGVAVAVWIGIGQARTPVRWDEVGFRVDGPTQTEMTFDVTKDPEATVTCRVQALSDRYAEVGVQDVTVGPAGTGTQRVTTTIPTAEEAVSAVVEHCEVA
ncbi:DUF4307 domain-containing protein [Cellulomonas hominis]|uniref:DUF4307 domain-containing protein n=1 Tax=Cellulomonas hominis TaxID=156981 RepID=UPI001BA1446C|nr:DUF4307 domain-containing protein [Cellulomonas hominis]VTR77630.1 hypothetical protein CHMI_02401 [Cellulomonas hominis]